MPLFTKVVGVTYNNSDGANRQDIIVALHESSSIRLKRDYANLYDPNAIMVLDERNRQIGFLSKEISMQLAPEMDSGEKIQVRIAALTGGGNYTRGVNIQIDK